MLEGMAKKQCIVGPGVYTSVCEKDNTEEERKSERDSSRKTSVTDLSDAHCSSGIRMVVDPA